jgi:hypothetical protein
VEGGLGGVLQGKWKGGMREGTEGCGFDPDGSCDGGCVFVEEESVEIFTALVRTHIEG